MKIGAARILACIGFLGRRVEGALVTPKRPPTINVTQIVDMGDVTVNGVQKYVARDLGFSGKIGSTIINVYGDTCNANTTSFPAGRDQWNLMGFVANSMAVGNAQSPMTVTQGSTQKIVDTNYGKSFAYTTPQQFCPYFPNENPISSYGMGITAVQDVDGVHGLLFFLKLYRPGNGVMWMMGGGIAKVDNSKAGSPTCTRVGQSYWDGQTMPWYGTYGSLSQQGKGPDGNSYIYAFGQANSSIWGDNVYLARVPKKNAFQYSAFTYWNGVGWQSKPLTRPQPSQAILEYLPIATSSSTSVPSATPTTTTSATTPSTTASPTNVQPSDPGTNPTNLALRVKRQTGSTTPTSTATGNSTSPTGTVTSTNTTRPFEQSGQATMYWSPYYKAYLMFEAFNQNPFAPTNGVQVRSSYAAQGPWSPPVTVLSWNQTIPSVKVGSIDIPVGIYAPAVQPWYDSTGKTVILTFTYQASVQRVLKLVSNPPDTFLRPIEYSEN